MVRSITAVTISGSLAFGAQTQVPVSTQDTAKPGSNAPRFEVASIRPSAATSQGSVVSYQGETFRVANGKLADVIRFAYGVGFGQERPFAEVEGEPDWVASRYDIEAKTAGSAGELVSFVVGPVQVMLQSLLADRFKLAIHWETRERPAYVLVRAPGNTPLGPGIRPVDPAICEQFLAAARKARLEGTPAPARPVKANPRMPHCGSSSYDGWILMGGRSMKQVADVFGRRLQQLVNDETGLAGTYDIELIFRRDSSSAGDSAQPVPNAPTLREQLSLPDAVREQLNLRLEPRRGMVDVLVIDHLERPSEN